MYFDEHLKFRARSGTDQLIKKTVSVLPDIYENYSHFIRCAVERELRRSAIEKLKRGVE